MRNLYKIASIVLLLMIYGCSEMQSFSTYRKETYSATRVTGNRVKTVQILNESETDVQHIMSVGFWANSNEHGHFQVSRVSVGSEQVGQKDIFVPPMGVLNVEITYAPLSLETTEATFNGWLTTADDRFDPVTIDENFSGGVESSKATKRAGTRSAVVSMSQVMNAKASSDEEMDLPSESDDEESEDGDEVDEDVELDESAPASTVMEYEPAIHRAMLIVAFDKPRGGYSNIELVGGAVPGPNGEETAVGMGGLSGGDCVASGTTMCFTGTFSIDLPGVMSGGAVEVPMAAPLSFELDGSALKLDMNEFPPVLILLKGNGPGEPLEGQPIEELSIVISGSPDVTGVGTFDGSVLSMTEVGFRIRVVMGGITYEEITPGLGAAVDFTIDNLEAITDEPFDGSKIIFGFETTLSQSPSGNGLFDAILGGIRVVVKFSGMLDLP